MLRKYGVAGKALPEITLDLKHALMAYNWPGNVRELENMVRKLTILRNPDLIARELHAKANRRPFPALAASAATLPGTNPEAVYSHGGTPILEQVTKAKQQAETEAILAALNSTRWNRKQAAVLLKIDYKALLYKMKKLGVEDNPSFFAPPSAEETPRAEVAGL